MKKLIAIIIVGLFFVSGFGSASQHTASDKEDFDEAYAFENDFSIELEVNIPTLEFGSENINGETFATLELADEGYTIIEGQAKLPVINYLVQIPQGADPEVSAISEDWEYTTLNRLNLPERITPVQPSRSKAMDSSEPVEFTMDTVYYSTDKLVQTDKAIILETGIIRGHHFALIQISPVQYNPVTGELGIMTSCELKIDLPCSDMKQTYEDIQRYSSPTYENLFKNIFVNYDDFEPNTMECSFGSEGYLIIVYDDFYSEMTSLAEWKESIYYDVTVTRTSEIPGGPTKDNIYNYIEDAYDTWSPPPSFVLLVGDTGQIPAFTGDASNTATDLYYATVDGSDYFADVFIGRFPASQVSHVTAMVDKTMGYEKGNWANTDFLTKGAFMAGNDNYAITEGTHNYVISNYFDPLGFTCDKLYEVSYGATTEDVRTSLNDGRVVAIYSGHGGTTSWGDGPPFSQSDVNGLTNQGMLSFVCSHACVTGKYSVGECFGETWIRSPNNAAIIFWGSSANTLWGEDDILEKQTLACYGNFEPVAEMTEKGKMDLYAHYGGGGYTKYYFECYNIFGDPGVIIGASRTGGGGGGGGGFLVPPRVGITNPSNGDVVSGTINVSGYAYSISGGRIKYVFVKIGTNSWEQADGTDSWNLLWDTTTVPDDPIVISAVSIDRQGYQSAVDYVTIEVKNIPDPPKYPDLHCEGSLSWTNITPGIYIYGDFTVENIGDPGSLLNWEVVEHPEDWGTWGINPSSGQNLTLDNGKITIRASVLVPDEQDQSLTGEIKIVNKDDLSDYEIIQVSLTTPKNKQTINSLFLQFLENHPNMFPILQCLRRM